MPPPLPKLLALMKTVVTGNVTEVAPAGTVMDAGTLTTGSELESATDTPPDPAGAVKVTVPMADWPIVMEPLFTEMLLNAAAVVWIAGLTVRLKVTLTPR